MENYFFGGISFAECCRCQVSGFLSFSGVTDVKEPGREIPSQFCNRSRRSVLHRLFFVNGRQLKTLRLTLSKKIAYATVSPHLHTHTVVHKSAVLPAPLAPTLRPPGFSNGVCHGMKMIRAESNPGTYTPTTGIQ